ncbi:MAG: hypothetical protein LBK71_07515 [Verrucomicrobiales bacterium]|jgi:hypothetical protein|nr:hypothetical protein [Verrucomicrobiales bacterium]
MKKTMLILMACGGLAVGCTKQNETQPADRVAEPDTSGVNIQGAVVEVAAPAAQPTFGYDAAFLRQHTDALTLRRGAAAIVVVPQFQGRVMTATADGEASSGWINYAVVKRGAGARTDGQDTSSAHMLAFGGEERFWMGPEGGQYSIFFAPDTPFDFDHWFTPAPIDSEAWPVASRTDTAVVFRKDFALRNHSDTRFEVSVERTVELLDSAAIEQALTVSLPAGLRVVGYRTVNTVTNRGEVAWQPDSGLLSVWLLCMFQPSPTTTVFIPYADSDAAQAEPIVNADYFGPIPSDRLKTVDGVIYFKCDGKQRGKLGVPPLRSQGLAGSYDPALGRVTLLMFTPAAAPHGYVNGKWELQKEPFTGDAINSYNDGPVDASGAQMGPFYEIESSSPALALAPGQSHTHTQTVVHLYGPEELLQQAVKVDLQKVKTAF